MVVRGERRASASPLASSSSAGLMMSERTTLSSPWSFLSSLASPVPSWPSPPVMRTRGAALLWLEVERLRAGETWGELCSVTLTFSLDRWRVLSADTASYHSLWLYLPGPDIMIFHPVQVKGPTIFKIFLTPRVAGHGHRKPIVKLVFCEELQLAMDEETYPID